MSLSIKTIHKLLNEPLPLPEELDPSGIYSRLHDDHDGTMQGSIVVSFNPRVGDVWVDVRHPEHSTLRFRDWNGGGRSLRVRNALVLLALAIKLDNDEKPDPK